MRRLVLANAVVFSFWDCSDRSPVGDYWRVMGRSGLRRRPFRLHGQLEHRRVEPARRPGSTLLMQAANKGAGRPQHVRLVRQEYIVMRAWQRDHMRRGHTIFNCLLLLSVKAASTDE